MYCPNSQCADLVKHGVRGEYRPGVTHCATCGAALVPLEQISSSSAAPSETELAEAAVRHLPDASSTLHGDLVNIASFDTPESAEVARLTLEARSIKAFIADNHTVSVLPWYTTAIGGVRLLVPESEAMTARTILNEAGL
jgi:hypothetical protein